MFLSIVIPAYNEAKRISNTLVKYWNYYRDQEGEFIIVVNGCEDNTLEIVKDFAAVHPSRIKYLNISEKIGKGGAVREGFKLASGDLIGFVDADGSTAPSEFAKLIEQIDGYDGAIASRWKHGSEVVNRNFFRKLVSFGFRIFVKLIFWLPFADTQCGAKVFKRGLVDKMVPKLKVNNMAFDVELLYRSLKSGYRIIEVPSRWVDKSSSAILGSPAQVIKSGIVMLWTLISIRFSK